MSRNRTFVLVVLTLVLELFCLVALGVCAWRGADAAYASAVSQIALAVAGGGGLGSLAQGLRHFGKTSADPPPVPAGE